MKIALGADHGGVHLKDQIAKWLAELGHEALDLGTQGEASVDYSDYARKVAEAVAAKKADRGVLVCGTGQGMCMTANRVAGIRAGVVSDEFSARMIRAHNDANVLCLGERVVGPGLARALLEAFLNTPFEGGRHEKRVGKMRELDRK